MIIEYHRPNNLEQALALLKRASPETIPLAGGTIISRLTESPVAVVDLQSLELNGICFSQNICTIGSMTRLQDMVENPELPSGLRNAARREANINLRRTATVGGVLISSDGASPLLGCFLALNAKITWEPNSNSIFLGEWLTEDRKKVPGELITGLEFPLPLETNYDDIARSPEDKPLVFVTTAKWESGEIRVVFGGCGKAPMLGSDGSKNMVSDIFNRISYGAALDQNGYTEYQQSAIKVIIDRLVPQTGIIGGKGLL
ncbi:MAG: FAD binding domain-containing protein [Leptolinea sp.]